MIRRFAVPLAVCLAVLASVMLRSSATASTALTRIVPYSSFSHYVPNIPYSGPINTLAVYPGDDTEVWAASETGGVFFSNNSGLDWTRDERRSVTGVGMVPGFP